jgi:transcriptional regulator with XRE-family HTH domain
MKLKMSKEWFMKNLDKEDKAIVSAGSFSCSKLDALNEMAQRCAEKETGAVVPAFGRLISLSRRNKGLTLEKLADQARIDLDELVSIEQVPSYVPEPRTACQLAKVLNLPEEKVLELSGNTISRDQKLKDEAVKFVASAQSLDKLSRDEKRALEDFVKQLSKKE